MKSIRNKKAGFTLPEVMVASVLSGLIIAASLTLLFLYAKMNKGVLTQSKFDRDGRKALRQLQSDIRRSSVIVVKTSGGTSVTNTSGSKLELFFSGGSESSFEFTGGNLVYDADGSVTNASVTNLLTGVHTNSSFTLQVDNFRYVDISIAIVDPFAMDGLQLFTINTTVANRIPL